MNMGVIFVKNRPFAYCIYHADTKEIHTVLSDKEYLNYGKVVLGGNYERIATIKSMDELHKSDLYFAENDLYNKFMDILGI